MAWQGYQYKEDSMTIMLTALALMADCLSISASVLVIVTFINRKRSMK